MWQAIALVSSGVTLVAFIIAVGAWVYKGKLNRTERLIRSVPLAQRGPLVDRALESLGIDAQKLSREQQYQIALRQLEQRAVRYRITAAVVIIIAILSVVTAIYSMTVVEPKPIGRGEGWPEKFGAVKTAELLVSEVDDALEIFVNDKPLREKKILFDEALETLDIKPLLKRGYNKLKFVIYNGKYGGCGSRVQVLINGMRNSEFDWRWEVKRQEACADCICVTSIKTLYLK